MKTLTINRKKYHLSIRSWDGRIEMRGPGLLVGVVLPEGTTLDSLDIREQAIAAIERDRQCSAAAREVVEKLMSRRCPDHERSLAKQ